ncbi:MAG: ABC transporter ATP-binding protein [Candidatus Nezhaarchaeota archaeon]|nr:ABC transporter ATP-binding protein [Candidatus Nezhaarchaeota archaeon]
MIVAKEVNAGYGKFHVLFDVTTSMRPREVTVIVGPNGSGKSTLLKAIFGLATVYSGSITLDGEDIVGLPPHKVARKGVAYLPQVGNLFLNLTVRENLVMATYTLSEDESRDRVEEVLSHYPILKPYMSRRADTLSGGERQILAMAMALIRRPKAMLFDEPTANLAPKVALDVLREISRLRDEYGVAVALVEQNAKRALESGDRAVLLVSGRVVFEGPCGELLRHPELGVLYLGLAK